MHLYIIPMHWVQSQHSIYFLLFKYLIPTIFSFFFLFSLYLLPPSPPLPSLSFLFPFVLLTSPFFLLFLIFFFLFIFFYFYFSPHRFSPPFIFASFLLGMFDQPFECPATFGHERTYCTGTQKTYLELCYLIISTH